MKTRAIKFTPYFEWVSHHYQSQYKIGVTDFALKALGKIIHLELPQIDSVVKKDDPCGFVESRKSVVDLLAPLSGVVVEQNRTLLANPNKINESPYEDGWLFIIEVSNQQQWDSLLNNEPHLENGKGTQDD